MSAAAPSINMEINMDHLTSIQKYAAHTMLNGLWVHLHAPDSVEKRRVITRTINIVKNCLPAIEFKTTLLEKGPLPAFAALAQRINSMSEDDQKRWKEWMQGLQKSSL